MSRKCSGVLEKKVIQPEQKQTCQHHWMIEPAIGVSSRGVCKYCGAVKLFLNIVEDSQPRDNLSKLFTDDESAANPEDVEGEADEEPNREWKKSQIIK